jgi:hypothetical protein
MRSNVLSVRWISNALIWPISKQPCGFDPNVEHATLQSAPPRRRNDWFRPGECRRRIHDVLRDATGPMTTREIVEGLMATKKIPDDDARTRELIHKTVLGSLTRATDTIERVEAAGSVAWRVI